MTAGILRTRIGHSNFANKGNKTLATSRARTGKGVLLPIHFACDLKNLGPIAGNDGIQQYFQFQRMASVCLWLLENLGGDCAAQAVRYCRRKAIILAIILLSQMLQSLNDFLV